MQVQLTIYAQLLFKINSKKVLKPLIAIALYNPMRGPGCQKPASAWLHFSVACAYWTAHHTDPLCWPITYVNLQPDTSAERTAAMQRAFSAMSRGKRKPDLHYLDGNLELLSQNWLLRERIKQRAKQNNG